MATTSIWAIKGWLGDVVIYVEDPIKTTNPKFYNYETINDNGKQGLEDVINYAMQDQKTLQEDTMEHFISGVNCSTTLARKEMMIVKKRYAKEDGNVAYHGYQSFAEGEVTPEIAHEIGLKLANELWGNRFQVIVATHLDKKKHIHNHFVLNSVSFIDGKKYNDCTQTYMLLRKTSDRLCKEYGLSLIVDPKRGKSKHYGEWKAEKEQRPTYRGIIKTDIDETIKNSVTDKQFFYKLKQKGYTFKFGKDITIIPQGKDRGIRLVRSYGDEYSYSEICKKILNNTYTKIDVPYKKSSTKKHLPINIKSYKKITGYRALYIIYCSKLGINPRSVITPSKEVQQFLFKEELLKLEKYNKQIRLLCVNKIDTAEQLFLYRSKQISSLETALNKRNKLRTKLRKISNADEKVIYKFEITQLSNDIKKLRKEVITCDEIAEKSQTMKETLNQLQQEKRKEVQRNEHVWRSRPNY